jgi:uncharacterized protein with FMN-binding domain
MKKYLVSGGVVAVFILYLVFSNQNSSSVLGAPTPVVVNTPTSTGSGTSTGGTGATGGRYKDGTYTGNVADAFYGKVQVAAIVQGGKLVDVQFLQYPNGSGHSSRVSADSLPILRQEAISAQSANVDVVSGATQTSQAFEESLANALAQATA